MKRSLDERARMSPDLLPSRYWTEFAKNFRYVYELSSEELLRIRYHTYHLTSDLYLTYYFASSEYKSLLASGYRYFAEKGHLKPMDEGLIGVGVQTEFGLVSHDLLRYLGVMCDIITAGLLDHVTPKIVLEIGGGYGGLARAHLLQNSATCYVICDLEETLFFSAVYLSAQLGPDRVHLVEERLETHQLRTGNVYIVPQSRMELVGGLKVSYVVSQQSLQEMTQGQVERYLRWVTAHADYFYSCNVHDHGVLAEEKKLVVNLPQIFGRVFSQPIWIGTEPKNGERFGDNHLPRAVYKSRNSGLNTEQPEGR